MNEPRVGSAEWEERNGRYFFPTIEEERANYDAHWAAVDDANEKKKKEEEAKKHRPARGWRSQGKRGRRA